MKKYYFYTIFIALSACHPMAEDPSQSADIIQAELLKTYTIDPVIFSPEASAQLRTKLQWVAVEKHKRLFQQLSSLENNRSLKQLQKRETRNIANKLSLIAVDRSQNPLKYAEINGRYLLPQETDNIRRSGPGLNPDHVNESYRLAWEYILLLPYGYPTQTGSLDTALEAVARIANPASVPTLLQFASKVDNLAVAQHELIESYYEMTLNTLLRIPSEDSAAALLTIYEKAKTLKAQDYPFATDWPEAVIFEFFDIVPKPISDGWLEIVDNNPSERIFIGIREAIQRQTP